MSVLIMYSCKIVIATVKRSDLAGPEPLGATYARSQALTARTAASEDLPQPVCLFALRPHHRADTLLQGGRIYDSDNGTTCHQVPPLHRAQACGGLRPVCTTQLRSQTLYSDLHSQAAHLHPHKSCGTPGKASLRAQACDPACALSPEPSHCPAARSAARRPRS